MNTGKRYEQKYEYDYVAVSDRSGGGVNLDEIGRVTEQYAKMGWRLVTVFTNELGKNAVSVGGFGVNSTMDQTILAFEREIIHEEIKLEEKTFMAVVPILQSNIVMPFVPKNATFFEKNGSMFVILRVFSSSSSELKGLQGNLIVRNVLGDEAVLEDVCFFSFDSDASGYLVSSPFPVKLPDKISYGVANAGLSVKRYIGSDGLVIPESTVVNSIAEMQASTAESMNVGNFLYTADTMDNAAEINKYVLETAPKNPDVFTEAVMERMAMFVKMELNYGNAKAGVMKFLNEYFESMGMK